jgi:hypothetical protein
MESVLVKIALNGEINGLQGDALRFFEKRWTRNQQTLLMLSLFWMIANLVAMGIRLCRLKQ